MRCCLTTNDEQVKVGCFIVHNVTQVISDKEIQSGGVDKGGTW